MDNVTACLFHALDQAQITRDMRVAFLNADWHPALENFRGGLFLQQHNKVQAVRLQQSGFDVSPDIGETDNEFDLVLARLPKNDLEAHSLAARGLEILKEGGLLMCAADNKAGGARIAKMLQDFDVQNVQQISKHKARAVQGLKSAECSKKIKDAIEKGGMQFVEATDFISCPGLFSWDRIDTGSRILSENLPENLKGRGADFGCGYGFLSRYILQCSPNIEALYCMDADHRALEACRMNLQEINHPAETEYLWTDLTAPDGVPGNLDFIVMNPPFHEGRKTDIGIGRDFIKTAAKSLRPGGRLWMVANRQLPYETALSELFSEHRKIYEGQGFKVFCALR